MKQFKFKKPRRKVTNVFIHCSASDNPAHDSVAVITEWHLQRGFKTIGYHYFINKKGTIVSGRPIQDIPAAQAGWNRGSIAICLHGNKKFNAKQFKSLKAFCEEVNNNYDKRIVFRPHNYVNENKTCPNFDIYEVIGANRISGRIK